MMDIPAKLKELEKQHNITILFAIENGSRAWGMESKDSDYDIRFVYHRKKWDYLSMERQSDVIQYTSQDKMYDFSGFDIFKFFGLLRKSNPTVMEWLQSEIIYYSDEMGFKETMLCYMQVAKCLNSVFNGYRGMCNRNYYKYMHAEAPASHKNYLYSMRGLCNAMWIIRNNSIPPHVFEECYGRVGLPDNIVAWVKRLIDEKKGQTEKYAAREIFELDIFIDEWIQETESLKPKQIEPTYFNLMIMCVLEGKEYKFDEAIHDILGETNVY